jgi:5-formyltetrahydrofolate cyclo-ligase
MESAVSEEMKSRLRSAALARRSSLPSATCLSWSRSIQAKVIELPFYQTAQAVALYCAVRNEVETAGLMDDALRQGKKVFCPRLAAMRSAFFVQVDSPSDLRVGSRGVAEPIGERYLNEADTDGLIVMVPGVLFDQRGHRLGRGGGWYDRALNWLGQRGTFIGLGYECQLVDHVPAQAWDQRVHFVITELRVIDCRAVTKAAVARSPERGCC